MKESISWLLRFGRCERATEKICEIWIYKCVETYRREWKAFFSFSLSLSLFFLCKIHLLRTKRVETFNSHWWHHFPSYRLLSRITFIQEIDPITNTMWHRYFVNKENSNHKPAGDKLMDRIYIMKIIPHWRQSSFPLNCTVLWTYRIQCVKHISWTLLFPYNFTVDTKTQ